MTHEQFVPTPSFNNSPRELKLSHINSFYFIKMPSTNFPWVKKPLLANAPMAMSAGPALAVAVSKAGGLGFIGPAMDANTIE